MKFCNSVRIVIVLFIPIFILQSCLNETKIEVAPKKILSPADQKAPVIPLPTPQRLRLLPVDMPEQSNLESNALVTFSPEKVTSRVESEPLNHDKTTSPSTSAGGFEKLDLQWITPPDWLEDTTKPMRVVSFRGKDNSHWECYISVLISQAGGVEANFKRWASQMGKGDMDSQTISQLADINILGKQSKILDITGTYTDMQGTTHENYRLLGVVCPLENKTLFVKMTGPEKEVSLQKDNFVKLCNSLALKN